MKYREMVSRLLWETVFPENIYCIGCGKPIKKGEKSSLCQECKEEMIFKQPYNCGRCGSFVKRKTEAFCEHCATRKHEYDSAAAAVVYDEKARKIVYDLKYSGKGYVAKNIAYIMQSSVENLGPHDIIIPVPMFKGKRKERGFCQTTLISENLSKITGLPLLTENLVRIRKTKPMSGLEPSERSENVNGAFDVKESSSVRGKRALLIDDLLTTGSTADECAKILKRAGAAGVDLAVFASPYIENKN